ncbi:MULTISPECIES: glycosyltransferase [unclassified Alteromonas]|uniref:glycosyltransferase n=1 Tax=unclassified Alteromonas TaxID=2614992 RepID=UPI000AC9AC4B|nr:MULTISPECIES: glycosyltransferase [unclassified Alteromonas]
MIKVLHVTYDMRIGGTEMVIKNIIEGNSTDDIDMSIFCIEEPLGPWGKAMNASGVQVTCEARKPGVDIKLIKALRKHIKTNNINVVHCHQYTPWVYGTLATLFTKAKIIFTEHGRFYPDSTSWKRKLVNPILRKLTSRVTAIADATRNALSQFEYIPKRQISLIYNGIAPLSVSKQEVKSLRKRLDVPPNTLIFGSVARFDPIKNHSLMLQAFKQVLEKSTDAKLLLIGDGPERKNIEATIQTLELEGSVILTGYIAQPAAYIAVMDVFLLSSLSEGTSMTLLEAMSLGKACIVTNAGGNGEIIKHNCNGIVVPNNDCKSFAQALIKVAEDRHYLDELGLAGALRFESLFERSIMVGEYKKLYRRILC